MLSYRLDRRVAAPNCLSSGMTYSAVGGEMEGKGSGDKTATATSSKIYLDGWDGSKNTIVIDTSQRYTPG